MTNQIQEQIFDIIAQKGMVDRSALALDKKLTELNISSLDVVEIVFALEDKFDIQIPFNANASAGGETAKIDFSTVGQVVDAVQKLVQEKAA